ncbi:hypothetical protein [Marinivivus vitaminiproducens]|uniref:hypothetical protein n=1 Tax=Marinivivus vitaminiproducens TaxID=3035935 RepID=UPI0027A4B58C|nr:hypothetical protein P4R82_24875 [Geminicoccaceae bacterium SCSIO 64248]
MSRKPTLGFAALKSIKPDTDADLPVDRKDSELDLVAERHGFVSREPLRKLVKRTMASEPTSNLSMRPPLSVFNRFVQFSMENRLSYPEALKELMDRAGVNGNGRA